MSPTRRLARPLLAAPLVAAGISALKSPAPHVEDVRRAGLPEPEKVAQAVNATKVAAGLMLATGRLSRVSALALAGTSGATAYVHHPFWKETEPGRKTQVRALFLADLGLLGGLLVTAADTGGRESVPHAAARISRRTRRRAEKQATRAGKAAKQARKQLPVG